MTKLAIHFLVFANNSDVAVLLPLRPEFSTKKFCFIKVKGQTTVKISLDMPRPIYSWAREISQLIWN